MTIPIICPGCHLKFPVESGITHAAANRAIANAMKLPPQLATALIRYLGLFAPKTRAINMDRLVRLIDEVQEQINTGKITYKGRSYNAPLEVWRIALEEIINKQAKWTLPKAIRREQKKYWIRGWKLCLESRSHMISRRWASCKDILI